MERKRLGQRVQVHFDPVERPSRTKQNFKRECDINTILEKFNSTGLLTHVKRVQGVYADVSEAMTYHESMNAISRTNDYFMALPAKVRARFRNDPEMFVEFVNNERNREEAIQLGLVEKPKEVPVVKADGGGTGGSPVPAPAANAAVQS